MWNYRRYTKCYNDGEWVGDGPGAGKGGEGGGAGGGKVCRGVEATAGAGFLDYLCCGKGGSVGEG